MYIYECMYAYMQCAFINLGQQQRSPITICMIPYVCMYVSTYVCMHVCMDACIYMYVCIHVKSIIYKTDSYILVHTCDKPSSW